MRYLKKGGKTKKEYDIVVLFPVERQSAVSELIVECLAVVSELGNTGIVQDETFELSDLSGCKIAEIDASLSDHRFGGNGVGNDHIGDGFKGDLIHIMVIVAEENAFFRRLFVEIFFIDIIEENPPHADVNNLAKIVMENIHFFLRFEARKPSSVVYFDSGSHFLLHHLRF